MDTKVQSAQAQRIRELNDQLRTTFFQRHGRVLITSGDGHETWGTVGVGHNIIEASWQALVDSVDYKLRMDERRAKQGTTKHAVTGNP